MKNIFFSQRKEQKRLEEENQKYWLEEQKRLEEEV